ncbi:hypothetical protein PFISCL1PPCAC_22808, partial [Pristionchus fissidentatus]
YRMELELFALNFVRDNPFFKKDAEKRMSASFCGSMSLVSETVLESKFYRTFIDCPHSGVLSSSSRSKSAFSLVERPVQQQNLQQLQQPSTMVVEGTTVKLRRTDSTRRKEMTARRETVEILMEEIVRENSAAGPPSRSSDPMQYGGCSRRPLYAWDDGAASTSSSDYAAPVQRPLGARLAPAASAYYGHDDDYGGESLLYRQDTAAAGAGWRDAGAWPNTGRSAAPAARLMAPAARQMPSMTPPAKADSSLKRRIFRTQSERRKKGEEEEEQMWSLREERRLLEEERRALHDEREEMRREGERLRALSRRQPAPERVPPAARLARILTSPAPRRRAAHPPLPPPPPPPPQPRPPKRGRSLLSIFGGDLEYGPGIVERLKAKFAKISTGDSKKRQKHKRHHSVDDILEESVGGVGDYDTYDRRSCSSHGRSTQTLDRSPRHSNNGPDLLRRASRSMADLAAEDYGSERRAFSLQRPSRREEYEREQQERAEYRYEEEEDDDMVNISELRKMFDRPGGEEKRAPSWRAEASRHDRFIERGKTHAMVPPNVGDTRRDAPPPRELRLTAPGAAISIDNGGAADDSAFPVRAVPLKKTTTTITGRRASAFDEEDDESLPEFVKMARRLRRATLASAAEETHGAAAPKPTEPLAIVTSLPPADPAQDTVLLASPPAGRRDSFTGAVSDVSPPPEEPKPPMSSTSSCNNLSEPGSRYSSLARSERSRTDSTSTHIPYSDLSLPRSDVSIASKASKRSVSTEGGVRMGYVAARSTSSERRSNGGYPQVTVPENQGTSGVEEMQRLLSRFGKRRPEERKEATASPRDELLAAREAAKREEEKEEEEDRVAAAAARAAVAAAATVVVLSPGPERRTRFVPAIIGMRSSDGRQLLSPTMTTSPSIAVELLHSTTPAVNVVSISVRDSAPSVIYTN